MAAPQPQVSNTVVDSAYALAAETAECAGSDCEEAESGASWSSRCAWAMAEETSFGLQGDAIKSTAPYRRASRYSSQSARREVTTMGTLRLGMWAAERRSR